MKLFLLNSRLPEFKSFEELEVPKHSKVKRQSSTSNAPEQEQKPDVTMTEWRNKPTHEILQKLNVRKMQFPHDPEWGWQSRNCQGQTIFLFVLPEKVATSLEVDGLSVTEAVMRSSSHGLILAWMSLRCFKWVVLCMKVLNSPLRKHSCFGDLRLLFQCPFSSFPNLGLLSYLSV